MPLEAVNEAIAYCKADPPEILADWEMDEALAQATGMDQRPERTAVRVLSPEEHEEIARRFRL